MISAAEARARGLGAMRGLIIVTGFDAVVAVVIWWIVKH